MLHNQRREQRERKEAEAAGASFWTEEFSAEFRIQLERYVRGTFGGSTGGHILIRTRELILDDEGLRTLTGLSADMDTSRYIDTCYDYMMPTVVEAIGEAIGGYLLALYQHDPAGPRVRRAGEEHYETFVNERLERHRISYEYIGGEMVEKNSLELHAEVVAPALRLLGGREGWDKVEAAYQDALGELHGGSPADAITDAGTAMQEALEALGCKGNALGPLIVDGRKKGLFASHDERLTHALDDMMQWVSADRSSMGDAHHSTSPLPEDAWLTVHIVGALIVRLANSTKRA
ncbi:hypothetical protein GCM10027406_08020 [Leifsonia lichenia]